MMAKRKEFHIRPDKRGVWWDVLLYVPTVVALMLIGLKLWYSGKEGWGYLLEFLATFFAFVGANRVAARLQLTGKSPVKVAVDKHAVLVDLKNGEQVALVKNVKFFSDYAGRSFAVTGIDSRGEKRSYVFHKGQFEVEDEYKSALSALRVFA